MIMHERYNVLTLCTRSISVSVPYSSKRNDLQNYLRLLMQQGQEAAGSQRGIRITPSGTHNTMRAHEIERQQ